MQANFERLLLSSDVGETSCAKQILEDLMPEDLLQFRLVSKTCRDFINNHKVWWGPKLKSLKRRPEFAQYFPNWEPVFDYFEHSEFHLIKIFIDGLTDFFQEAKFEIVGVEDAEEEVRKSFEKLPGFQKRPKESREADLDYQMPRLIDRFMGRFEELKELRIPLSHPIHYSIENGNLKFLQVLLQSPANFNELAGLARVTPVIAASRSKHENRSKVINLLLEHAEQKELDFDTIDV